MGESSRVAKRPDLQPKHCGLKLKADVKHNHSCCVQSMASKTHSPNKHNWYPPWAPRFWNGMRVMDYFRLLLENRFQIHPLRYPMAGMVAGCAVLNSGYSLIQNAFYGRRIEQTELVEPPVFVIGHWRSGTTLMHELLALDPHYAFPCNYDAFVPCHFLLTRPVFYPLVKLLMPPSRPMDNMEMGIASPQEDDFALVALGAPTPYRRMAFPNRSHRDHLLLNLANADDDELRQLEHSMRYFLKTLTVLYKKPLVVKSPPHTGRIAKLAEWFPGAKFIHIARHPYSLLPSTMRLWKTLDTLMGFQIPKYDDATLKNYIFECQDLMYTGYHQQRSMIPPENLIEIRFEDLVADPIPIMNNVYQMLGRNDFDQVRPSLEGYFEKKKSHQQNVLSLDENLRMEIDAQWPIYMKMFGYEIFGYEK